jgi:SAM-dependent methyltransferase
MANPAGRTPLLGKRFRNDGVSLRSLNPLQVSAKSSVERKIRDKQYEFESVPCAVCDAQDGEPLSEKDRYGLTVRVCICRACGLIQTNPRMNQRSYADFYDSDYRQLYLGTAGPSAPYVENRAVYGEQIYRFLYGPDGVASEPEGELSVLEVGCGGGGILKYFRDRGHREYGVDLGSEYVEFSRREFGLNLHIGTIDDVPATVHADVVIYSHVLEHILDLSHEIREIARVLAPDGLVYVEVPGVKNIGQAYGGDFLQYTQNAHVYHFSLTTLQSVFAKHGFVLIRGTEYVRAVFKFAGRADIPVMPNDYLPALQILLRHERRHRIKLAVHRTYNMLTSLPVIGKLARSFRGFIKRGSPHRAKSSE